MPPIPLKRLGAKQLGLEDEGVEDSGETRRRNVVDGVADPVLTNAGRGLALRKEALESSEISKKTGIRRWGGAGTPALTIKRRPSEAKKGLGGARL